ncbi:MAG TPA: hypothetical protein VLN44_02800 [Pyrinomonadaceae bacterium]|nr:hypothetical protein [Pyrinomonadaceae bacterium]
MICLTHYTRYSPDGTRIAFVSDRSGSYEIWTCDSDGSKPVQATNFGGGETGTPRWSPDGQQIAFDGRSTGSSDIFIVNAYGGSPHQVTTDPSAEIMPVWSNDGKWIFFGSDRAGDWQIWRVPFQGGQATQITKNGGYGTLGATNDFIYYTRTSGVVTAKQSREPGVWRVPVDGGEEIRVFDQGEAPRYLFVNETGVYRYNREAKPAAEIEFYEFANKKTIRVLSFESSPRFGFGLSASPDGKWIIWSQTDRIDNDIMLVENFR